MQYRQALAFTGHRPDKLGGYGQDNPQREWIKAGITHIITRIVYPEMIIVGGALGVDTWAAEVAHELRIPFVVAVPFKGQESRWPQASQDYYRMMLQHAAEIKIVCPGEYSIEKMHARDKWMVDKGQWLCAVWDGSNGGTGHTVRYATKIKKPGVRLDPRAFFDNQIQAISELT